jgi:hypothetical protein
VITFLALLASYKAEQSGGSVRCSTKGEMGWEQRSDNRYYYRKKRIGDRVVSEYIGRGELAELIAELDALDRARRQTEREAWRQERVKVEAIDRRLAEVQEAILTLIRAWLLVAGYHTHKGQWRKRRKSEDSGV